MRGAIMSQRVWSGFAVAAALMLAACGGGSGKAPAEGDMALGAAEGAKVTVIEYASVTCGACAQWHSEVWPAFKAKYVDTNQVRFVFREFPTPPAEISVAGFLVARCAGADQYFDVVGKIMDAQPELFGGGTPPRDVLVRIAGEAGLNEQQFTQCVTNPEAVAAAEARTQAARAAGVTGTPTFLVNGRLVQDRSLSGLSEAIDPLLAAN